MSGEWTPQKQRAADAERAARAEAAGRCEAAITAAQLLEEAEGVSALPLHKARHLRERLQMLGDWDVIEEALAMLFRRG